jgi:hypothetical protein
VLVNVGGNTSARDCALIHPEVKTFWLGNCADSFHGVGSECKDLLPFVIA